MSFGVDLPEREPWILFVEVLKLPLKKLDNIFTGEAGLKTLFLSPSRTTCIDLRILQKNEMNVEVNAGLLER